MPDVELGASTTANTNTNNSNNNSNMSASNERTPLLADTTATSNGNGATTTDPLATATDTTSAAVPTVIEQDHRRHKLYAFLEAKTPAGALYERFVMTLIVINVLAFVVGSLFVQPYNPAPWADRATGLCGTTCDALWFGNYADNGLAYLNVGATSWLELVTVFIFTIEYILRLITADLENAKYQGWTGRLLFVPTFFSLVDLAATLPFYVDAILLRGTDLAASQFLRMFRVLRMMRAEGRYDTALTMVDDVWTAQRGILLTAGFVGVTTWLVVSALYYLAERRNMDMVYCAVCDDVDGQSNCTMDDWGIVDCGSGCTGCYNLYESIPMASYYALLNLFGEFPHIDTHSAAGKVVGTVTAAVAVAVFALPVGIIGNGFEDVIAAGRVETTHRSITEEGGTTRGFVASGTTWQSYLYNLLHAQTVRGAASLDMLINLLVVGSVATFVVGTFSGVPDWLKLYLSAFEFVSVVIFTTEYILRAFSVTQDPKYDKLGGRVVYMWTFLAAVDLLSFLPYWGLWVLTTGHVTSAATVATLANIVQALRLLRILRFERYTHAFLTFDDVVTRNKDVLAVTAFTALLFWIFFSACLYFSERDSLDEEMASNYNTIPNSMWITLLNLAGESPLAQYSFWGKISTAILGLFATGVFGIPIGVLGAGFEEIVEEENQDNTEELERRERRLHPNTQLGTSVERAAYKFVNGLGSVWSQRFELTVYALIVISVAVGAWQTVEGEENSFREVEWIAVVVFSVEYIIRLVGAGADPLFATSTSNGLYSRIMFMSSFYSVVDLLAIIPYYLALALPNSIVDEYDEYLRMIRILRLIKLDKYVPSITLIDDVIRLKFHALRVAFYAAVTLWILFAAAIHICEHKDYREYIDPVPLYGCFDDECNMSDRFHNFFDSMVYTAIHLTGDYPIITYSWPARFVNFFMVISAVGVVSIPSGLIASGFVQIVQSKGNRRTRSADTLPNQVAGDDWYEITYRELRGVAPPLSRFGPKVDEWQLAVNEFLNGKKTDDGHHQWTKPAYASRVIIFAVIIANVLAVLLESVPKIDKAVGNDPGNFFDRFECFSVMVFATEYALRLFCAPKNREALYSSFIYATTFFGIVDFLSTAPWFIEKFLILTGLLNAGGDSARIFRIFRIFRILQLEDFITAFSKLDNVFRASKDVLKATALMAMIVWVGCAALFFIFEENNPNWRSCDASIPLHSTDPKSPGCYDFVSTAACNLKYPGMCEQNAFTDMPDALYYTAVFLGGEWGVVDFTWPGRIVCLFLCIVGIGLYSIPIGTLFDSFGAVLGLGGDDEEDEDEGANESSGIEATNEK